MKVLEISSLTELSKTLKAERHRLGLTQWQVAEKAYAGRETVRTLEQGRYTPYFDTVIAIARALGYEELHIHLGGKDVEH